MLKEPPTLNLGAYKDFLASRKMPGSVILFKELSQILAEVGSLPHRKNASWHQLEINLLLEEENHEDRQSKRLQRETDRITTPGCACVSSLLRDAITQGTTTAP